MARSKLRWHSSALLMAAATAWVLPAAVSLALLPIGKGSRLDWLELNLLVPGIAPVALIDKIEGRQIWGPHMNASMLRIAGVYSLAVYTALFAGLGLRVWAWNSRRKMAHGRRSS